MSEKVAILDCGGQYTKVIDRKVRELKVESAIFPINIEPDKLQDYQAVILSGGPESVWTASRLEYHPGLFALHVPVLGICYGMHLINAHFGGTISPGIKKEYGETVIEIDQQCPLFTGLPENEQTVLMSHGDSVQTLAGGFQVAARSLDISAAIYHEQLKLYGVQFHPEVDLTTNGNVMLANFLLRICGFKGNYILADRINTSVDYIRKTVGNNKILVLVSGGVDSTVSAALLLKALPPENIFAIHVDSGLMRKNESDLICHNLTQLGLRNMQRENAADLFFDSVVTRNGKSAGPLTKLTDPEEKRNLIGDIFIRVVKQAAEGLHLDFENTFWAQGTLRPDLIESGNPDVSSYAHKIKTHHNDVELVRQARARGLVIETNWDWHKDEVRQVALMLGIDEKIAFRQPFPGPGLAVRMICNEDTNTVTPQEQQEFAELIRKAGRGCAAQVIPIRTVGVKGDCRSYHYLSVLSGAGLDFNWDEVYQLGKLLPNKLPFINRVVYTLNRKTIPGAINNYPMHINRENVALLREIDALATAAFADIKTFSMVFAVLLPIGINKPFSVAIRIVITNDYMTARPAFIGKDLAKDRLAVLVSRIEKACSEIDFIFYDITSKPPSTIEWE